MSATSMTDSAPSFAENALPVVATLAFTGGRYARPQAEAAETPFNVAFRA